MSEKIYRGESKGLRLHVSGITSEDEAVISLAVVSNNNKVAAFFSTEDGSLVDEDDSYYAELTADLTRKMLSSRYRIEGKIEGAFGTTIRNLTSFEILNDKIYEL